MTTSAPQPLTGLKEFIGQDITIAPDHENQAAFDAMVAFLRDQCRRPEGLGAILLYGSGLWQGYSPDKIWDIQILVDHLADFSHHLWPRLAGRILSPNVYFFEKFDQDGARQFAIKCNVMTINQFEKHGAGRAFTPHIWARFCQPCKCLYTRDPAAYARIVAAISDCVITFHRFALSYYDGDIGVENNGDNRAKNIWMAGLRQTYRLEWRSESKNRPDLIYDAAPDNFDQRSKLALSCIKPSILEGFPSSTARQTLQRARRYNQALRPWRKAVAFIRIIKSATTFEGGVAYALWKIERHSGQSFQASPLQHRYPLIFGWPLLWRIWRSRALR